MSRQGSFRVPFCGSVLHNRHHATFKRISATAQQLKNLSVGVYVCVLLRLYEAKKWSMC